MESLADIARLAAEVAAINEYGPDAEVEAFRLVGVELDGDVARVAAQILVRQTSNLVAMTVQIV